MNKIILISIGVLIVVGVGVFAFLMLLSPSAPATAPTSNSVGGGSSNNTTQVISPGQSAAGNTLALSTIGGGSIQTKDFKKDPAAGQYPASGYYYLGFHPVLSGTSTSNVTATEDPPYTIVYIDPTQYFIVELLQEPISTVRQQAEQYLMERLGINQTDMCRLKYALTVPASVNSFYAGQNLGFSFCPGAVQL